MIVLGIESATESVGAAVADGEGVSAAVRVTGRRRHAENLAPAIAEALERSGIALADVEAIAVDLGPGLFTGLRVGVATAKGLAQGLGVGVLGATSLEILAWAAFDAGWPGTVVPVVDGRRGEVFAAHYRRGAGPSRPLELSAPSRYRPDAVVGGLGNLGDRPVLACGDGALRYRELFERTGAVALAGPTLGAPDPSALVALAAARLGSGEPLLRGTDVAPIYLRDADARINWVQRAAAVAGG
jgi:tRNA threonylcarbamoyladenosine biosynthesis protein TsaB